jgi:hypothetical protein
MIIFLRNLPVEARKFEIAAFINRILDECFLDKPSTKVSVGDIETLSIQDVDANKIEKHGLVRVFPNEVGKRVIKKLNGTTFKRTLVSAHEYVSRSVQNDPRNNESGTQIEFQDRRIADRRRSPLLHSWQKDPILVHSTLS